MYIYIYLTKHSKFLSAMDSSMSPDQLSPSNVPPSVGPLPPQSSPFFTNIA